MKTKKLLLLLMITVLSFGQQKTWATTKMNIDFMHKSIPTLPNFSNLTFIPFDFLKTVALSNKAVAFETNQKEIISNTSIWEKPWSMGISIFIGLVAIIIFAASLIKDMNDRVNFLDD